MGEIRSNRTSVISKTSSARRVLYLKVKALREQGELQTRLEKMKREAIQREIADLHEVLAREGRIADIQREMAEASSSQATSFQSVISRQFYGRERMYGQVSNSREQR